MISVVSLAVVSIYHQQRAAQPMFARRKRKCLCSSYLPPQGGSSAICKTLKRTENSPWACVSVYQKRLQPNHKHPWLRKYTQTWVFIRSLSGSLFVMDKPPACVWLKRCTQKWVCVCVCVCVCTHWCSWVFVLQGGVKVLITGPWQEASSNYSCLFDQISVPASLIQPGVLRCYCPGEGPVSLIPVNLSMDTSIYLSFYVSIYLSDNLCICLFIFLSIYLFIYVSVYLFIYLSIYLCINLFIYISI